MSTAARLRNLAADCQARALNPSPVFMRALAECIRQAAADVAMLEAVVLPPAATAPRTGNVVPLDCAAIRRLRDQVILPPDGGNAA